MNLPFFVGHRDPILSGTIIVFPCGTPFPEQTDTSGPMRTSAPTKNSDSYYLLMGHPFCVSLHARDKVPYYGHNM